MDHSSGFCIRTGTPDDYDRLGRVFDEAEVFHREPLPHIFCKPGERFPPKPLFDALVLKEHSAVLVAEEGMDLVGFVTVRVEGTPDSPIMQPRRIATVDMLAVRSDQRRHGIGRALMAEVHQWAADRELRDIALNVWEFNRVAIAFYQSLGYHTLSRLMERRSI